MTTQTATGAFIHPSAIVSDGAQIHETAKIGAYVVIGPQVKIGAGTVIGAQSIIDGQTTIGQDCRIYASSIGLEPQDLKYKDEPTQVIIGDRVTIREYSTIHRATGDRTTEVGDDSFLMNYSHVAHDCKLGKGVIMANNTCLAGHTQVGDYAVLSGYCITHQFVRIGRFVMMGGMSGTRVDLPPFTLCDGRPTAVRGINAIGLRRGKIAPSVRTDIKQAYKLIYRSDLNFSQALTRIEQELAPSSEINEIVEFFRTTKRGMAPMFGETTEKGVMDEGPVEEI